MHRSSVGVENIPLSRSARWLAVLISTLLLGAVGLLDYETGREASFTLLYLLPICSAAWFIGRGTGIAFAVAAAACGLFIGTIGQPILAVAMWNAGIRFGVYLTFATLVQYLKTHRAGVSMIRTLNRMLVVTGCVACALAAIGAVLQR